MSIISCTSCGARNRLGPIPRGTPRCSRCKTPLAWVVDASGGEIRAWEELDGAETGRQLWAAGKRLVDHAVTLGESVQRRQLFFVGVGFKLEGEPDRGEADWGVASHPKGASKIELALRIHS